MRLFTTRLGCTFFVAALAATGCGPASQDDEGRNESVASDMVQSDGGVIVSVGLDGLSGKPLAQYMVNHPARFSLTIKPSGPVETHHLQVGLIEENGEQRSCMIGDWHVTYGIDPQVKDNTFHLAERVVIPDDCLGDLDSGVYNLWVGIDPLMEDELAAGVGKEFNTQFFDVAGTDLNNEDRNALCVGPHGEPGCVAQVNLVPSNGHNLEASRISTSSSIGTLDGVCSVDGAMPLFLAHTQLYLDGSRAQDGKTEGTDAADTLSQIIGGQVGLQYDICPRDPVTGACAPKTSWAPLSIGSKGGLLDGAVVSQMLSGEPSEHDHPLYAQPDGVACARIVGNGLDAQDWTKYDTFNLRACATPTFKETRNGGAATADNCVSMPVHVTRAEAGKGSQVSSVQFRRTYNNSFGNSVVGVNIDAGTDSNANLAGASTHNWANANLTGWFSRNLVHIWADAAAYVAINGSFYDIGIDVFGNNLWHPHQTYNGSVNYSNTWSQSYSRSVSMTYNYGILGLGLNVTGALTGTAGISATLDLQAQSGSNPYFPAAVGTGWAHFGVTPSASLAMSLSASANLAVLRGGVTGTLNLLGVSLPANASLRWGSLTQPVNPSLGLLATGSLSITINTLSGNVRVWVDARRPAWCGWHPCLKWSNIYNQNIASWGGSTWSNSLYTYNYSGTLY